LGTGFYGSMTQTTLLKQRRKIGPMMRLQSHKVHPTELTIIQQLCSMKQKHTKYTQINTNKSMHSEMDSVTNPNPENCKNCSSKCAYDCAELQYIIQHRTILIISSLLQTNIIAQMLSIRGEGVQRGSTYQTGCKVQSCEELSR